MYYIREDITPGYGLMKLSRIVISPWILMLILGALGERLSIAPLLHLGYGDVLLIWLGTRLLIGHTPIDRWVASQYIEDVR